MCLSEIKLQIRHEDDRHCTPLAHLVLLLFGDAYVAIFDGCCCTSGASTLFIHAFALSGTWRMSTVALVDVCTPVGFVEHILALCLLFYVQSTR